MKYLPHAGLTGGKCAHLTSTSLHSDTAGHRDGEVSQVQLFSPRSQQSKEPGLHTANSKPGDKGSEDKCTRREVQGELDLAGRA